jgi:hypothetical protein
MGSRGARSKATTQDVTQAALDLLGERPDRLLTNWVTHEEIAKRLRISRQTVSYHFGPGGGELQQGLAELAHRQIVAEAARNAEDYATAAQYIDAGARPSGRAMLQRVLLADLHDYQANDAKGTRGRERLHYLMLALCDLDPCDTVIDYAERLRLTSNETQAGYAPIYDAFCWAAHRDYVTDRDRTQRAIHAYLEGVTAHRRFEMAPPEPEIVDTVLRLFYVTTKPVGGADLDLDGDLFGSEPSSPASVGVHATVHHLREQLYAEVADRLEALTPDESLLHCALHSTMRDDEPPRDELARRLWTAQQDHVARGGRLRRIARFVDVDQLDLYVSWIAEQFDEHPAARVESRALVMEAPPGLAPLVAGNRLGALGREDRATGGIADGVCFTDPQGIAFCEATFDSIWDDARSYPIASPSGIDRTGVRNARRSLVDGY